MCFFFLFFLYKELQWQPSRLDHVVLYFMVVVNKNQYWAIKNFSSSWSNDVREEWQKNIFECKIGFHSSYHNLKITSKQLYYVSEVSNRKHSDVKVYWHIRDLQWNLTCIFFMPNIIKRKTWSNIQRKQKLGKRTTFW